jgi:hypothetical protein
MSSTRELHRLQFGDGRDCSGPTDLGDDALDAAGAAPRRELERQAPSRRACRASEASLELRVIHLRDDAVHLVGQLVAVGLEAIVVGDDFLDAGTGCEWLGQREAEVLELLAEFGVAVGLEALGMADAPADEVEPPPRDGRWVEQLERAGDRVARVAERGVRRGLGFFAKSREVRGAEDHLSPDFDAPGPGRG